MTNPSTEVARDDWEGHWRDYDQAARHNPAQRYRRQIACRLLERAGCAGDVRILDIGSGQGDLALDLHRNFPTAQIAGLELSARGVEISREKVPAAQFFQCDLLEPAAGPNALRAWAGYAVCSEVLEHLDHPAAFLQSAGQYLAARSVLVVTVPGGPQSAFDLHIGHRRHFTPGTLRALLENSGFTVELATTAGFPFFNLYRLTVILRGRHLIADVDHKSQGWTSWLARAVMALFRPLFALNILGTRLGWQTVAVARWNAETRQRDSVTA
ncbi:MAG: class I SAM-dependent methyltransferase [Bryobacteraceae bacterium]